MDSLKQRGRRVAEQIARVLAATGITPNTLTILTFFLNVGVGVILALGYIAIGGALVIVVGALDSLDGGLARVTGKVSTFGAFLDSTLDRYSEAVIFLGLLLWYVGAGDRQVPVLIFAVLVGSIMVSYTRARAEGLGLRCEVGLLARPERIVLLGLGLIVGQVSIVLWILAVLTNLTALQRIIHVWRMTKEQAE